MSMIFVFLLFCGLLAFIVLDWDMLRYPVCPKCKDNSRTKKQSFFSSKAICSLHGEFALE